MMEDETLKVCEACEDPFVTKYKKIAKEIAFILADNKIPVDHISWVLNMVNENLVVKMAE